MDTSENLRFQFQLPPEQDTVDIAGLPTISKRDFGRITVMLGANGSGKSRLLKALSRSPEISGQNRTVVYVEGGRTIAFPADIDIEAASRDYDQRLGLTSRVHQLLAKLETDRDQAVSEYFAALYRWAATQEGPVPAEPPTRLKRINEAYIRLLPRRTFSMTPVHRVPKTSKQALRLRNWYLENDGVSYDIATMSDGEKQVLCLLADIGEFAPPNALVLVDEPELNLHPQLAMDLWGYLETKLKDAVFLYATHSLSFAMRPNVTDIMVLGGPTQEPLHIGTPAELSGDDLLPFLGSIAAIITAKQVLVVEGKESNAFDSDFYRWVIGPTDVAIVNVGSCDKVRSALNQEGIWRKAGNVKICGLIDRDFRSEERLRYFADDACEVLGYHEAESYLCLPELLVDASGLSGANVSHESVVEKLAAVCASRIPSVALRRTIARSEVRLSIGPERGEEWPKDKVSAKTAIDRWIASESPRANAFEANAVRCFEEELDACEQAVAQKDADAMLRLFPWKELLKPMLKLAGFHDQSAFEKSVYRHLSPDNYPPLAEIREAIRSKMH